MLPRTVSTSGGPSRYQVHPVRSMNIVTLAATELNPANWTKTIHRRCGPR